MSITLIWIKKYWKYLLTITVASFIIIYYLFIRKNTDTTKLDVSTKLADGMNEVKENLIEISNKATIETVIAKTKHEELKKELKETVKIKDKNERRKKLIEMADFMGTPN
jgi:hypothetical protein